MAVTKNITPNKVQKSFYMCRDIEAALLEFAEPTGAPFTRMMTAAVLQYLCSDDKARQRWMSHAMRIDTKKSTWDQVRDTETTPTKQGGSRARSNRP